MSSLTLGTTTVVVLLGGKIEWYLGNGETWSPEKCDGRVAEAFRLWNQFYQKGTTYILAKQYPHTRDIFRQHFSDLFPDMNLSSILLQGEFANIFQNYGFDSIEECVMCRYALEQLFSPTQKVKLVVVTSDFHAKRANFLFQTVFSNTSQFIPSGPGGVFVSPSATTRHTNAKYEEGEIRGLDVTAEKFGASWATWYMSNSCLHSNLLGVKALIKFFGKDIVNKPLLDGAYPLHCAASWGWTPQELIQLRESIENSETSPRVRIKEKMQSMQGQFTRHSSYMSCTRVCLAGFVNLNLQIVKELVQAGADVNIKSAHGATALHYAISQGAIDVVVYLVSEAKASLDIEGKGHLWIGSKTARELIQSSSLLKLILQDNLINKLQ